MIRRACLTAALLAAAMACEPGVPPTEVPAPVSAVRIDPLTGDVWAGDERQLTATPVDASGAPLFDRQVSWSSRDPMVASVDSIGRLAGRGAGSTVIEATAEGKRGELAVTVYEADILYEGYWTGLTEMFVLSLLGGEPQRFLPLHTVVGAPVAAPDGSRIAYVIADYIDGVGDIWIVDRDGSNPRQITFDSELDDHPAWSPDGTRIAFRSYRAQRDGDIWVMGADGSAPVLLTPDPLPGVTDESRPAWSPDGSRIAYASTAGGSLRLWTMAADGSDKRQLTSGGAFDTEPSWPPDGQWIVFRRGTIAEGSDLMLVRSTGGQPVAMGIPWTAIEPSWSPDGRHIAFTVAPAGGGSPQIYTIRPDGTDLTLRTHQYFWGGGRSPSWLRRSWPTGPRP